MLAAWIVVGAAALYAWQFPSDGRLALGWNTVVVLLVLAVVGEVVEFVAEEGYDPAYGARHLHRSIEEHLLETLVDHQPAKLRARVAGGEVRWEAKGVE